MRLPAALAIASTLLFGQAALAAPAKSPLARPPAMQEDAVLKTVVQGAHRAAENRARDQYRRPYESLAFWGLRPGATVVELSPGGGYWTEILAPYARQTRGTYIAGLSGDPAKFRERFADQALYGP
jgi:predicted methyltransferase